MERRRWGGSCRDMGAAGWVLAGEQSVQSYVVVIAKANGGARRTEAIGSEAEVSEKVLGSHVEWRGVLARWSVGYQELGRRVYREPPRLSDGDGVFVLLVCRLLLPMFLSVARALDIASVFWPIGLLEPLNSS
jgi:hypothetical protein